MEQLQHPNLPDSICDLRSRKIKRTFFTQINELIDWSPVESLIKKHYKKGKSVVGKPSYSGLLLFKMSLRQAWYGLSDYEVEDRVNDSISLGYFCGLTIGSIAPDHSTLSRFRSMMTQAKAYQALFHEINSGMFIKSITLRMKMVLVLGVVTTEATTNEIANLEEVLDAANLPERIAVKADKGYQSQKNADLLKKKKLKNHILKKAKKNRPLTEREKKFNKPIGQTRFKVERTFGGIKRWFNGGVDRYRGIEKMHTQNLLEALCYNLYRSPRIIASNCEI